MRAVVFQSCLTFATLWTVARQAPLSKGFSRQEYWSGLLCPPPGDCPNPGIKPRSPTLQVDSLPSELPGKALYTDILYWSFYTDTLYWFPLVLKTNDQCFIFTVYWRNPSHSKTHSSDLNKYLSTFIVCYVPGPVRSWGTVSERHISGLKQPYSD